MLVGDGLLTGGWWSEQVLSSGEGSPSPEDNLDEYAAATPAKSA